MLGGREGVGDWGSQATSLYHTHIVCICDAIRRAGERSKVVCTAWWEGGRLGIPYHTESKGIMISHPGNDIIQYTDSVARLHAHTHSC